MFLLIKFYNRQVYYSKCIFSCFTYVLYLCTIQYNGSNVFIKYYSGLKSNAVCKNFICMNFAEILHLIYRKKRNSVQSTQDGILFSFKELFSHIVII